MVRVLQVVGTMDLGGAETLIMNIYRNIDRSQVQFDFLCHNRIEAKYTEEIYALGGRMYCVPGITHVGILRYQQKLYKFFCEHPEYETVHSHHDILSGIILKQAKKAGIPNRYSHAHNTYVSKNLKDRMILGFMKSYFTKNVTHAFACADIAGETLYRGKLRKQFEVIPNVIDVERFRFEIAKREKVKRELNMGDGPIIGHIGRFAEQKNHKFLLEIFKCLLSYQTEAQLVLVGEGRLKQQMENYVNELGIGEHVHFMGSRRDIVDCLCAMDLFLFPSFFEGLSVVCVEAQATGLPILTSDAVSDEIVITNLVKQLSLQASDDKWAQTVLGMLKTTEKAERETYAETVRQAGFDVKSLAEKMQVLYQKGEN